MPQVRRGHARRDAQARAQGSSPRRSEAVATRQHDSGLDVASGKRGGEAVQERRARQRHTRAVPGILSTIPACPKGSYSSSSSSEGLISDTITFEMS